MFQLNLSQIDYMKHAIGFERRHVKRGKYIPYRNYFDNGEERDSDWDLLIEQGLAAEYKRFGNIIYCVTDAGKNVLSRILDVIIMKEK